MPHMKMNIKKNLCPVYELPKKYSVTLIDVDVLTRVDRRNWYQVQFQRKNVVNHDKIRLPTKGAAVFAKYYGDVIGVTCLKHISPEIIEHQHAMILTAHRRKGVFKTIVCTVWRYCYLKGYTWINLSPGLQKPWWDSLGAKMKWAI